MCSYLCEVQGISPEEAIDRFKRARPPGIKHEHFINALYKRYSKIPTENSETKDQL